MLKQFWQWLRGNLAYDAIKYVVESKLIMALANATIAGFIAVWYNYGPLVIFSQFFLRRPWQPTLLMI